MSLLLALEFLTIVRLRPIRQAENTRAIARSQAYFPAIGLVVGATLAGVDHLLAALLPPLLCNAILVVLLMVLTGGLHLDGLGDTADGVLGGHTPEQRLAIMKDPRLGSYGTLAIVALVILKCSALTELLPPLRTAGLLATPTLARWNVVAAMATMPYGRPDGLWPEFYRQAWPIPALVAGATALVIAVVTLRIVGVLLFGVGTLAALGMAFWFKQRLGGLTGDTYGAIIEVTETLLVILLVGARQLRW